MNPLFSVYTPTNNLTWLIKVYNSLLEQAYTNWEWVLVVNGPKTDFIYDEWKSKASTDPRIKVFKSNISGGVGVLKYQACNHAIGDILVELDHDDVLVDTCLQTIADLYNSDQKGFYYSDWVGFTDRGQFETYAPEHGWESYNWKYKDKNLVALKSFPVSARALCEIFYAPNHVRAWTREAYNNAGGYDPSLRVADDHDLVIRTYLSGTEFYRIDSPQYLYRIHATNTVKIYNAEIQKQQALNKDKYLVDLAIEETRRKELQAINIGIKSERYKSVNISELPMGILELSDWKIPLASNSVNVIRCTDSLQLVPQKKVKQFVEELYRVLAHGGWLFTSTPSTDGRGAFQDIRHVSWWNENTWTYWSEAALSRIYYGDSIDHPKFQIVRSNTQFPSQYHKDKNISYANVDMCVYKNQILPGYLGFNRSYIGT
jgi:glycosyltransferase involved in cell wall biosynthesis